MIRRFSLLTALAAGLLLSGIQEKLLSQEVPPPPSLLVRIDGKLQPMKLTRYEVSARIFGRIAETTATMTFANPNNRVMEGDLYFPLPEGSTIAGYALDIEGKMVDGVAVEKEKGRVVFEKIVRQGIDPGLIEWTRGNNFHTRVFPIPANGSRTIRVCYVSRVVPATADLAAGYHLPLNFKEPIGEFSLRIEVVKPGARPEVRQQGPVDLKFEGWRDSFVAETKMTDVKLSDDIIVDLPEVEKQNVLVEKAPDGQVYFAIFDTPAVKQAPGNVKADTVTILWDASASRAGDHAREIELLGKLLGRLKEISSGGPAIDLILLRDAAEPARRFERNGDGWISTDEQKEDLLKVLAGVAYDGATRLSVLKEIPESDLVLLFTDGLGTLGPQNEIGSGRPLWIFSDSSTTDHAFLRYLAMQSGGRYFNLKQMADDKAVVEAVGRPAYRFLEATIDGGRADELFPKLQQPIDGPFLLVGQLDAEAGSVALQYGFDPGQADKNTVKLSKADAAEGVILQRLWAQAKLADLLVRQQENEKKIAELGKQFGMVTPFTSLIVLDSLDQYVEYRIEPPATLPEMRAAYQDRIASLGKEKEIQKQNNLDEVVKLWQERVEWWETKFKYEKDFKFKPQGDEQGRSGGGEGGGMGGMAAPGNAFDAPAEMAPSDEAAPAAEPARDMPAPSTPAAEDPNGGAEYRMEERLERFSEEEGGAMRPARSAAAGEMSEALGYLADDTKDDAADEDKATDADIELKPWDPDTPYLKALKEAEPADRLAVYLKNRAQFGASPAFYLDCADFFRGADQPALARRVLGNVAELNLEDPALMRILGRRLVQLDDLDDAVWIFERVLELRPEEPQSYRDLALALSRRAERESTSAEQRRDDFDRAIKLYYEIVLGSWDGRFPAVQVIALEEMNRILPKAKAAGVEKIDVDERLIKLLDVDVRIVMTWDADMTDIDLHVVEPSGEVAFYGHNRTTIGGLVSNDFTQGYGPEEYMVHRAMPGKYTVKADFFGSNSVRQFGAVTVQVDVFTNYGRENEKRRSLTIRLSEQKEQVEIGTITIGAAKPEKK